MSRRIMDCECVLIINRPVSCAKTAEPIEMLFGEQTHVGPVNHALDGIRMGATWRIQLNYPCSAAMRAIATIYVPTCYN